MARKSGFLVAAVSLAALSAAIGLSLVWLATEGLMTDRLRRALHEGRSGKSFMESQALKGSPLAWYELVAARNCVCSQPGITSYHLLMALREQWPEGYEEVPVSVKTAVLCGALDNLVFLNDWGHLGENGTHDSKAGAAMLELGEAALCPLRQLLDNTKEAPFFGSADATKATLHKYRRADFAYMYIMRILGRRPRFLRDTRERDLLIASLKNELDTADSHRPG